MEGTDSSSFRDIDICYVGCGVSIQEQNKIIFSPSRISAEKTPLKQLRGSHAY